MLIKNVAVSLPSRVVSNEEVVDLIRFHSSGFEGDVDRTLRTIKTLLDRSGLVNRRWCGKHESPIDHVAMATRKALSESYLRPEQIELFIFVGIGRGFLEPGNSHMMASALGFVNAECFDVVDACMSWTRAMSIADSLFKAGQYRNAMIVNAEFNMLDGGPLYPANFELKNHAQVEYTLPSFTIGEAATATLVVAKEPDNFRFEFRGKPEVSDLCTIPIPGYEGFCHPSERIGKNGDMRFTSYGHDLHKNSDELIDVFAKLAVPRKDIDIVFTHASSKAAWHGYGVKAGIDDKMYHVYPDTGNLVSASIPAAISLAKESGALKRGDRALCWVGSAGMSFNVSSFIF
ncbi:3-oxoacyl-[acyl-carrier-protein] synthase III C-terminal domain-containing protein [Paraburkholderia tropica]|uniref:3-oxoacyl-[acyl-carrier-protein] synthase III n=1 Tax=Paraburkholderia tropica TaxID=92647 RepID=A0ABX5MR92_9BURK|nr:3-oxoacyl-[acyl-carrier-protein] synthase III C-terminal domain-containing protein [Paraburkholderia tropica]PXX17359.1 3-oxoacyl-[acyl-carrier-protein] synthase III [Paraburkholderia tropica]PZW84540.1 3-oxoacyl-[acyl-carrier-protein] synthase III [Paraburkholderia tropica]QNB15152.1 3-oxoacyl-ACP synthase [Paraburkholderia tropica]